MKLIIEQVFSVPLNIAFDITFLNFLSGLGKYIDQNIFR